MGVYRKSRAIMLSVKAKDQEDEAAMMQDYGTGTAEATTNLVDVLKQHMNWDES